MKTVSLRDLGLDEATRRKLADTEGIHGVLVLENRTLVAFGPESVFAKEEDAHAAYGNVAAVWRKHAPAKPTKQSRTAHALQLLDSGQADNPNAAAKAAGVDVAAVYRELRRREARGTCPCCGRLMPA